MESTLVDLLTKAGLPNTRKYIASVFEYSNDMEYTESSINDDTARNFMIALEGILKLWNQYPEFKDLFTKSPKAALAKQDSDWDRDLWDSELKRIDADISNTCTPNTSTPCPVCGKKTVHVDEVQARSNDEGKTYVYYCCTCTHSWQSNS